jgi:predicted dehydrogenase
MSLWTRRRFVGAFAAGAGGALASSLAPRSPAFPIGSKPGPKERLRLGVIGTGGRAHHLMKLLNDIGLSDFVALSDVYEPRLQSARALAGGKAETFADFRRVLDRKDVEAVVIATPDHWHCPMITAAVAAGKDVYVEKPLSRTIEEGALTVKAVRSANRIVQVGLQQRSWPHFVRAKDLVREGRLGKINLVLCHWYQNYPRALPRLDVETKQLDWKAFLGSAREQPFDPARWRFWRFFWDFAGGILTDLLTHWIDVIQWAMDEEAPRSATAAGARESNEYFETPDTVSASFLYSKGFLVTYNGSMNCSLTGGGIVFRGDKGYLELNRDRLALFPEGVKPAENTSFPEPELLLTSDHDGTKDHLINFLDSVRSRQEPNAPVEVGHSATRTSHLGNLSLRSGKTVEWDGASGRAI